MYKISPTHSIKYWLAAYPHRGSCYSIAISPDFSLVSEGTGSREAGEDEIEMGYVYLCIAITAEVIATTSLKSSDGFTKAPQTALVIIGYAVAFYFLSLTLKYMSTGVAYAIWSGIGTVMITLAAWIWHGQRLDTAAITGIAMIIAGVIVMNLLSSTHS